MEGRFEESHPLASIRAMSPVFKSPLVRYLIGTCLLAIVVYGLFSIRGYVSRRTLRAQNEARVAEGSRLNEIAAVDRKSTDEAGANVQDTADQEQKDQTPAGGQAELEEALAARQKELEEYNAKRRTAARARTRALQDEEVRSLLGEISELRKSLADRRAEYDDSREALEKQLSELRERNTRLREKIGKVTSDRHKRAN